MEKKFVTEKYKEKTKQYYYISHVYLPGVNIISEIPSKYLKYLYEIGDAENTVKSIAFHITYYLNYLAYKKLTEEDVLSMDYGSQLLHFKAYEDWLLKRCHIVKRNTIKGCNTKKRNTKKRHHPKKDNEITENTCNQYLCSVFGYLEYLINNEICNGQLRVLEEVTRSYLSPAGVKFSTTKRKYKGYFKTPSRKPKCPVSQSDMLKFCEAIINCRDALLIAILADTGIRIGEAIGIKFEDIDLEMNKIEIVYRDDNPNGAKVKYHEERSVYISVETAELLKTYCCVYRKELYKSEYLFIVIEGLTTGTPLNYNAAYQCFDRAFSRSEIDIIPHKIRHFVCNELRHLDWKVEILSALLGHKHISTTQEAYFDITENEKVQALKKLHKENAEIYEALK